ncbi:hypothetical protein BDQ17DRAFT_478976 [Cyathus striatus]|nr:hypothetical protein BDQ17DRAFT_478976 [Cyathus striatus]
MSVRAVCFIARHLYAFWVSTSHAQAHDRVLIDYPPPPCQARQRNRPQTRHGVFEESAISHDTSPEGISYARGKVCIIFYPHSPLHYLVYSARVSITRSRDKATTAHPWIFILLFIVITRFLPHISPTPWVTKQIGGSIIHSRINPTIAHPWIFLLTFLPPSSG